MNFDEIDYWRFSDNLSVVEAAMLACNFDPGVYELAAGCGPEHGCLHKRGTSNNTANYCQSSKFIAVFSAIRDAVITNKIVADITNLARAASYNWHGGEAYEESEGEGEESVKYDALLKLGLTSFQTNVGVENLGDYRTIIYLKEPDWTRTTVSVDSLKAWMEGRNFRPPFFFPDQPEEGFRNSSHPRYAPKLAAAVSAWEAVEAAESKRTVKQTLVKWLNLNASKFGLIDESGAPLKLNNELAEVANWETRGGAPKSSPVSENPLETANQLVSNFRDFGNLPAEDDGDLPF